MTPPRHARKVDDLRGRSAVAAWYAATVDETIHVLRVRWSVFRLPLITVARLALSVRPSTRPSTRPSSRPRPEPPDHVARDRPRPSTAAERAARRWALRTGEQRPRTWRADLAAAVVAALWRPPGVAFAHAVGGRRALVLDGQALDRYLHEGGPVGALGRPISERRAVTPGPDAPLGADQEVAFARGTIYLDGDGRTKVVLIDDELL